MTMTIPTGRPSCNPSSPAADGIPRGPFGDAVRLGQDIFLHPQKFAGDYVGTA